MKKLTIISLISLLVLLAGNSSFAQEQTQKIALIIEAYAIDDSNSRGIEFKKTLEKSGFITYYCKGDCSISIKRSIREFGKKLRTNSNSLGLFYYYGPIINVQGENYFLPPAIAPASKEDISSVGVSISKIIGEMAFALNRANFIILDPNNNNLYPGQNELHTLAQPDDEEDVIFVYTTKPGQTVPQKEPASFMGLSGLAALLGQEVLNLETALNEWHLNTGKAYFTNISLNHQVSLEP